MQYILLYLQVGLLKKLSPTASSFEGAYHCLFPGAAPTELLTESCVPSSSYNLFPLVAEISVLSVSADW